MKIKKFSVIKRLLSYSKPYLGYLVFALISAIISVSMTLFAPVLIGDAIDFIIGKNDVNFSKILHFVATLAVVIIIGAFFQWIMTLCTNKIAYKTVRDIRISAFKKLNKVPLKYVDRHSYGDIISTVVNDIDMISDGLLQGFTQLFTGIITILGTLVFMFSINAKIGIIVVVITPLSLLIAASIAKRSFALFREQSAAKGELSGFVDEMIGNQKIVKAFGFEKRSQEKFEEINARLYKTGVKSQFISSVSNPSTRFVNGIVYAAVGIFGAISAINGGITIGQINTFLTYANQYTKPFNEITGVITELQSAFSSAKRVFDVLDSPEESSDDGAVIVEKCDGSVKISDVSFSYNPNSTLIEGLNLNVKAGERVAIVGPTGCGKTTIINLLMRFYDTTSGKIEVSNVDIRDLKRSNLRGMYGMVLQETWLFSGTVRENIAYGKPNATDEEIFAAAKLAHADGFIKRLANGYNTPISENGGNISQGQKQLLCIARIMLTKPPMLILDEATSNIDTRTEIRIQKAFATIMEGRTSFIVAHRLSTIKEADTILVMNNGHIVEQGNHDFLLKKGGFYANLFNSNSR